MWSQYTLRTQLLIVGISASVVSLIIVLGLSLGFLGAIISNITSTSTEVLTTQLKEILTASVEDSAALFENDLNKTARSIGLLLRRAAGDTFRADQPLARIDSYFDSPEGVQRAGETIPKPGERYAGQRISLRHSTFLIAKYNDVAPPALTPQQQLTVDATAHLDVFFRNAFKLSPSLNALYCSFEDGVHRSFPGVGNSRNLDIPYDPTSRGWHKDAISNPNSDFVVSDPYRDAFGRGWMYTVSARITNSTDNRFVGVAAIDVLIETLKKQLEDITVKDGSTSLYLTNGIALSSPSWNVSTWNSESPFMYKDAKNPSISEDLWNDMMKSRERVGSAIVKENYEDPTTKEHYLLVYMTLSMTNGRISPSYVVLCAFPLSKVTVPIQNVSTKMNTLLGTFSTISVGIFVAVLVIVATSVAALASAASRPLVALSEESMRISNNIGNTDLTEGVGVAPQITRNGFMRVDETEELTVRFYSMIRKLRESASAPEVIAGNVFFDDPNIPNWNESSHPQEVVDEVRGFLNGDENIRPSDSHSTIA